MKILFVCHNDESIQMVYDKVKSSENMFIIFVGDKPISDEYSIDTKILVARNYTHNIEKSKKLLTFTAWYFIVHNELFPKEDHLCILEYDVNFDDYFLEQLTNIYNEFDIISFQSRKDLFDADISMSQMTSYLSRHNLPLLELWWPTTNHCIRRDLLVEFVNFYYYTYQDIKDEDNISFYHERIFSSYTNNSSRLILDGLKHIGIYSHQSYRYKKYLLCYDNDKLKTNQLICDVNNYSPETEVICCNSNDIYTQGKNLLWKPFIIYELINEIEPKTTLMYVDNSYSLTKKFDEMYMNLQYIKAWKYDEFIPFNLLQLFNQLYNLNIKECQLLHTDIILFENKPETIRIIKQWLDICTHFSEQPISSQIPNYVDILFSILIHLYNIVSI